MLTTTLQAVAQPIYDRWLRPHLPNKYAVYAGVTARDVSLLDATDRFPNYKRGLLRAIHETVGDGDAVVIVGGGRGVSSVHACRAGAEHVAAYEAAAEMCKIACETVDIADVADRVDIHHALVGEDIAVYGDANDAATVPPRQLRPADVLLLDCEGAEASILDALDECPNMPSSVIVETHPERGIATERTASLLADAGYTVERLPYKPDCEHETKCVLVGRDMAQVA